MHWREVLNERLPLYGHRNWIVIADSAYPEQANPGIETVVAAANQLDVVQEVLNALAGSAHVKPLVYVDRELDFVPDEAAPGVDAYRCALAGLLQGREVASRPHEEIIHLLDEAAKTFKVLIVKTTMTIPYTSVFLCLDCAYWNAEAERQLRSAIANHGKS